MDNINLSTLAKLAKVIFGLEGSQNLLSLCESKMSPAVKHCSLHRFGRRKIQCRISRIYDRVPVITATSRNGDMSKRRQSKTATNEVKTVTTISQNGDNHWSKRRRILVKTVTIVSQNGDRRTSRSQSICFAHAFTRRLSYNSQLLNGRLSLHDQLNVLKFNSSFAIVTSLNHFEKRKNN